MVNFLPALRLLVVFIANCGARRGDVRVYNGDADLYSEFPFVVRLQMLQPPFRKICSGSLIAENWVLTAGHCIDAIPMAVKYEEFTRPALESKSYARIITMFQHPGYAPNLHSVATNDIALILIDKIPNANHSKVMTIDYKSLYGLPVKYAGFGITTQKFKGLSINEILKEQLAPLQVGEGVTIPCNRGPSSKYGPAICIAPKCTKNTQQVRPGDSGGPVVYNGRIIGVVTSGHFVIPIGFYAPVSPYLSWMREVMKSN